MRMAVFMLLMNIYLVQKKIKGLCQSRNAYDNLEPFKDIGILVKIVDISATLADFTPKQSWIPKRINAILIIEALGVVAENERNKIRIHQRERIEAAKQNNIKFAWL